MIFALGDLKDVKLIENKLNDSSRHVNIGYGKINLSENTTFKDKIVKYAEKEMTIEEIEKKLGHKVKIVGEKGE